jgi:hypothetical protein
MSEAEFAGAFAICVAKACASPSGASKHKTDFTIGVEGSTWAWTWSKISWVAQKSAVEPESLRMYVQSPANWASYMGTMDALSE